MNILSPELINVNGLQQFPLTISHPYHMVPDFESVLNQGKQLADLSYKIGADSATGSRSFAETMLASLDKVSAYQQFASSLNQQAITDPDSVDVHDLTIAQAEASMSLNITRNILNRIVQSWRDIINTR